MNVVKVVHHDGKKLRMKYPAHEGEMCVGILSDGCQHSIQDSYSTDYYTCSICRKAFESAVGRFWRHTGENYEERTLDHVFDCDVTEGDTLTSLCGRKFPANKVRHIRDLKHRQCKNCLRIMRKIWMEKYDEKIKNQV